MISMTEIICCIAIVIILIVEVMVIKSVGDENGKLSQIMNRLEYELDETKYLVYIFKEKTVAWNRIEDIPKDKKSSIITLKDNDSSQKIVVSSDIIIGGKKYCKLYLINDKRIKIYWIESNAICRLTKLKSLGANN